MPKARPQRQRRPSAKAQETAGHDRPTSAPRTTVDPQPSTSRETSDSTANQTLLPPWWDQLLDTIDSRVQRAIDQSAHSSTRGSPSTDPGTIEQAIVQPTQDNLQGTVTSVSQTMLSLIPTKVKEKIWAGEFVEMSQLLSKVGQGEESFSLQVNTKGASPALHLIPQKRAPLNLPLLAWVKAWNRYGAIVTEQSPNLAPLLAHHMETVLNLAEKGAAWASYDECFRRLVASGEASWGCISFELYMKAHLEASPRDKAVTTSPAQAVNQVADIPKGACFKFHSSGSCLAGQNCAYQHKCYICLGSHPAVKCQLPRHTPFKVLPRFALQMQASQTPFRAGNGESRQPPNTGNRANQVRGAR
jgi:hypothetical protein